MKLLSIVFSFRNEEKNLEELVNRNSSTLKSLKNWSYEIIFVNDDSTDSSLEVTDYVTGCCLFTHNTNIKNLNGFDEIFNM